MLSSEAVITRLEIVIGQHQLSIGKAWFGGHSQLVGIVPCFRLLEFLHCGCHDLCCWIELTGCGVIRYVDAPTLQCSNRLQSALGASDLDDLLAALTTILTMSPGPVSLQL